MTAYTTDQIISNEAYLEVGDDCYIKKVPLASPWATDHITPEPLAFGSTYTNSFVASAATIDRAVTYFAFRNDFSAAFTVDWGADINKLTAASILSTDVDTRVYFKGSDLPSNLVAGKPYWAINVVDGVSFEVEATQGSGTPVDLGDNGSGSLTFTITSRRSATDQIVGSLTASEAVLIGEGEASTASAERAAIKAKTDLIGTVRALIKW